MPGLFDRLRPEGLDGSGGSRIDCHLLCYGINAYVGNVWTRGQVIAGINSTTEPDLSAEEIADFDAIADRIDALATNTQKLIYGASHMEPSCYAAELGLIDDAQWRNSLEIS